MGETNVVMAAKHYLLAAQSGNAFGLRNYGMCLLKGEGVTKDLKKGRECLLMAQKMGALDSRSCAVMLTEVGGQDLVDMIKQEVEAAATEFMSDVTTGDWFNIYCKLPAGLKRNLEDFLVAIGQGISDKEWDEIEMMLPDIVRKYSPDLMREIEKDPKLDAREKQMSKELVERCFAVICTLKRGNVRTHDVKAILQASKTSVGSSMKTLIGTIAVDKNCHKASITGGDFDKDTFVYEDGNWQLEDFVEGLRMLPEVTKQIKDSKEIGELIVKALRELKDNDPNASQNPPPISVTFREGFLSDGVLQVKNLSDKRIWIHIHVSYPPTSEEKDMDFSIEPNATEEYGSLEMSWQFSPGGGGWISVQGYDGKVNFELLKDNQYRTW